MTKYAHWCKREKYKIVREDADGYYLTDGILNFYKTKDQATLCQK